MEITIFPEPSYISLVFYLYILSIIAIYLEERDLKSELREPSWLEVSALLLLLLIYVAFLASFSTLFYTWTESILSRALRTQYANREISRRGPWVLLDVILLLCHSMLLEVRQSKSNSGGYSSTKPWEAFVWHLKTFNLWSMGSHWRILYKVVTSDSCIVRKDRMVAEVWKVGCEAKRDSGQVGPKDNQYDDPVEKSKSQWWQVICSIG